MCGGKTKKNGTTSAGKTRYRCLECGASRTIDREVSQRRYQLEALVGWLCSNQTQAQVRQGQAARTFRANTAWCWNVQPMLEPTGELFDEIQLDGIYVQHGHCCLIAHANGHVVDFQWCTTENSAAWGALLARIPAPAVVIIDGGSGLAKALRTMWPETKVQRCLVHIQRNVRQYMTRRPRTTPGKQLAKLNAALTKIQSLDEAAQWMAALAAWHSEHHDFLNEKTYNRDPMATRPWQWTHDRVRKAYNLFATQARKGTLFQYLQPDLLAEVQEPVSSTTNRIEGGVNAPLRQMLSLHRGMRLDRRKRAVEWWLHQHTEAPVPVHTFIQPQHYDPTARSKTTIEEPIGPALYDRGFSTEEGIGIQRGWKGL